MSKSINTELVFEPVRHFTTTEIVKCYNGVVPTTKREFYRNFKQYLPTCLKTGLKADHIWISDRYNERIANIYFK